MAWYIKTLTVRELFNIDSGRIERSKSQNVKLVKTFHILKKESFVDKLLKLLGFKYSLVYYKLFKFDVTSDSGNTYTVFIRCSPGFDKNLLNNKLQVFCSCSDFMYRSAWNLNRSDNLYKNKNIEKYLAEALKIRPTTVPGGTTPICKHVYAVLQVFRLNLKAYGLIK